jgi:hypothetical protein
LIAWVIEQPAAAGKGGTLPMGCLISTGRLWKTLAPRLGASRGDEKAKGKRTKAKVSRPGCLPPFFPFCLLPFAFCLVFPTAPLLAQDSAFPPPPPSPPVVNTGGANASAVDGGVVPVGCASCGGGLLAPAPAIGDAGCAGCGGPGGCNSCCYPGRYGCDCCCDGHGPVSKVLCGLYQCICCNDPCYEPHFVPLANAALFVDPARPVTQMRIRTDFSWNINLPDKAEWFWAKEYERGPRPPGALTTPAVPAVPGAAPTPLGPGERKLPQDRELYIYNEAAVDRFSLFVELSYRDYQGDLFPARSGFGDMNIGTKSLLLDCELIQLTFQFKTFLPTGNFTEGLGNGHVSLEPSLLGAVKLTPDCYFQFQVADWIPVGGSTDFQGNVFHYHLSLNHLLCNCGKDIQLIGTAEADGFKIVNGQFTDPATGLPLRAVEVGNIFYVGAGLRLSICNKIDFGVGGLYATNRENIMGKDWVRAEFRWRF